MTETLRVSHAVYNIRYYFVWIVKYRKDLIQNSAKQRESARHKSFNQLRFFDLRSPAS